MRLNGVAGHLRNEGGAAVFVALSGARQTLTRADLSGDGLELALPPSMGGDAEAATDIVGVLLRLPQEARGPYARAMGLTTEAPNPEIALADSRIARVRELTRIGKAVSRGEDPLQAVANTEETDPAKAARIAELTAVGKRVRASA